MPASPLRQPVDTAPRSKLELALAGSVDACWIHLQTADGTIVQVKSLPELVAHLRERPDPSHAFVESVAALGTALHCALNHQRGIATALEEAADLLRGYPAMQTLIQLERCADRHSSLLTPREVAGRLVFEARRMVRALYPASVSHPHTATQKSNSVQGVQGTAGPLSSFDPSSMRN